MKSEVTLYVKKYGGNEKYSLDNALFNQHRIIMLEDEIDAQTANNVTKQIMLLGCGDDEPITIMINSPGGIIEMGLKIVDAMKACPCPINTVAFGSAASMAAVILANGTKGHRYIAPHSSVLIHEPLINNVGGSYSQVRSVEKSMENWRDIINTILSDCTGKTKKEIDEATSFDNFMTATEAQEFGLVDKILQNDELIKIFMRGE